MKVNLLNTILSNEYSYFILLMVLTAIPVGFVAGLFGIGGGLITVPFLYYVFGSLEIDQKFIRAWINHSNLVEQLAWSVLGSAGENLA